MNGLRFKVGELAIFAVATRQNGIPYVGSVVEVVHIGPFHAGQQWDGIPVPHDCDYFIESACGRRGIAMDWQLQKLDPPAEPKTMTVDREQVQVT